MTEATTRTRAPRRSAELLAAEAQARANALRAKAGKAKRAAETRQKVIAGSGLMGLAESGDAEAVRLLERIKANLTRPQDRAAFGLAIIAKPAPIDAAALDEAVKIALKAHGALPEEDKAGRRAAAKAWREAVIAWELATGTLRVKLEDRQRLGFGDLGELAQPRTGS